MGEIPLTLKIIIIIALCLSIWGLMVFRRQSRELATRLDELKRQKFVNKQARIADEIANRLRGVKSAGNQAIEPAITSTCPDIPPKEPAKPPVQPAAPAIELISSTNVSALIKTPKQQHRQIETRCPPKETKLANQLEPVAPAKKNDQKDLKRMPCDGDKLRDRSEPLADFRTNPNKSLYHQLADFAKWVAAENVNFRLEQYENGVQIGHVQLLFDESHLKRLNGHWIDLFRPDKFNLISDAMKKQGSGLYCPFSSSALARISTPAKALLNRALCDPTAQNLRLIKECALEEFCSYLDDLHSLARSG